MQVGTQTASLVNHLMSRAVIGQPEPEVGMGATILRWSDRSPATVIEIFKIGKNTAIRVQEDRARLVAGSTMSEAQDYEFTRNENGTTAVFMCDDQGCWHAVERKVKDYVEKPRYKNGQQIGTDLRPVLSARWSKTQGNGLRLGERDAYRDPTL